MTASARRPLALFAGLGLALGLVACSSSSTTTKTPPTIRSAGVTSTGPTILVPRSKDIVEPKFTVAGTHGTVSVDINVAVSGPYSDSKMAKSQPSWKAEFDAGSKTGEHTATASAKYAAVQFFIQQKPPLTNTTSSVAVSPTGATVTVSGKHTETNPTIVVSLFNDFSPNPVMTKTATVTGDSWTVVFNDVSSDAYAAQASMGAGPNLKTASQFILVP